MRHAFARPIRLAPRSGGYNRYVGAAIVSGIVTGIVVVVVLVAFVWAAREDGRAQRRQDRLNRRR